MTDETKTQLFNFVQHTLARPDTYIGSIRPVKDQVFLVRDAEDGPRIIREEVKYNPGLLKIFQEILSNAIDNKWRSEKHKVPMKYIKVSYTDTSITVENDGYAIPVIQEDIEYTDPDTNEVETLTVYPAEVLFGHERSSTNYNDEEDRLTSGRNGIGAKATNIFSKRFVVTISDPKNGRMFEQEYTDNMTQRTEPRVTKTIRKTGFVRIEFEPDLKRFKTKSLKSLQPLIEKEVYDAAMVTGLKVTINGQQINVDTLEKYAKLYDPKANTLVLSNKSDYRVILTDSKCDMSDSKEFSHVAFVNGIHTKDGGIHVDSWKKTLLPEIAKKCATKIKGLKLTAREVGPYFTLFIAMTVPNPEFASQTKDKYTAPSVSTSKLTDVQLRKLMKWPFVAELKSRLEMKEIEKQEKEERSRIPSLGDKLKDANWAGGKRSHECTLFVTEGLSAKTFVTSGTDSVPNGHNTIGAYALRGKFINVQSNPLLKVNANEEVKTLKLVLGLKMGQDYSDDQAFSTLRYGKVVVLADADKDGQHIKGLVFNFIYTCFPSLFERGYVQAMSTPIVRVWLKSDQPIDFFAESSYKEWERSGAKSAKKPKYYKGLGTFTSKDAKEQFKKPLKITYTLRGDEPEVMDLGFGKSKANARKEWICSYKRGEIEEIEQFEGDLSLSEFVSTQLVVYHSATLRRALPCLYDGFKESQRKAFYGTRKAKLKETLKVERLAGSVAEATAYHHGGKSMEDTIIKLAQDYIGTNNVPLFEADGQFGSRLLNGEDAAASRYISTRLTPIADILFPKIDDQFLERMEDDGDIIEPVYYIPIIPMILVNGSRGIATAYNNYIPCHDPLVLCDWIEKWLNGEEVPELIPWFRGFKGEIEYDGDKITTTGVIETKGRTAIITELPVGVSTASYRDYLGSLTSKQGDKSRVIKTINDFNTDTEVHFEVTLEKDAELNVPVNSETVQLNLLIENDMPHHFADTIEIMNMFCAKRFELYKIRKKGLIASYEDDLKRESSRYRYLKAIVEGELVLNNHTDESLINVLEELDLLRWSNSKEKEPNYDYLLNMATRSLTSTRMEKLAKELEKIQESIDELRNMRVKDLWLADINCFREAYQA